jgi:hypothetical protein
MPWTLLCESAPRIKELPELKGYASPTSFSAAEALAVKMTVYSGGASKNVKTAVLASSACRVETVELKMDR